MSEASLLFDAAEHRYTLEGRDLPSVTTVLQMLADFERVPWETLEAARLFGQRVHEACALLVRGILDWESLDPALVPYLEGARNFLKRADFLVIASELRLAHRPLRYAGTLDLMGELNGAPALVDFKSGALPRSVGPQTSAYAEAYHAMHGKRIRRRYCVQLNPEFSEGYKVHALTDATDWSVFLSCLNVWRFKHGA